MTGAVIVEAVRTPVGRVRGALSGIRADYLGAIVLDELLARARLDPTLVEDVIFGCVTQVGEQCGNIGRTSLLSAGWPETIPGMTVDRKCGSSETALHMAVGQVTGGGCGLVVAGGAESMSRVPMGGNRDLYGEPFGAKLKERFDLVSQGEAAERLADKYGFTREDLDDFAFTSHSRAMIADLEGRFAGELVAVDICCWQGEEPRETTVVGKDETIRWDTSRDRLAMLKASFRSDGRITAGNSSQISDGAAALLIASEDAARAHGLRPRAAIRAIATVGSDPELMLTGPIAATSKVLARAGLSIGDIDLVEINEAFAPVPLAWLREFGGDPDRLNVNGGAIALGHPLGASGARIMTTLLHELERRGGRYGLQSICCAGGIGTATIIELLN